MKKLLLISLVAMGCMGSEGMAQSKRLPNRIGDILLEVRICDSSFYNPIYIWEAKQLANDKVDTSFQIKGCDSAYVIKRLTQELIKSVNKNSLTPKPH